MVTEKAKNIRKYYCTLERTRDIWGTNIDRIKKKRKIRYYISKYIGTCINARDVSLVRGQFITSSSTEILEL